MTAQTQPAQPKTPGFAADGKTPIYSIVGVGIVVRADEFNRLHAENESHAARIAQIEAENKAKTKQINALQLLQSSQQSRLLDLQKMVAPAQEAVATLQSERDANARLTTENEQLRSRPALSDEQIRDVVWGYVEDSNNIDDHIIDIVRATERAHGIGEPT